MSVIELTIPIIGESVKEVTLSSWLKADGDYVERDELICEIDSDKATVEVPAEQAGILTWVAQEGDDLEIGAVFAKIDTSAAAPTGASAPEEEEKSQEQAPKQEQASTEQKDNHATGHPSPAARKILAEKGIDSVEGTGKDGRITKADALAAEKPAAPKKEEPKKQEQAAPVFSNPESFSRETRTEKMSRMRRTIASRLVSAKNNTAMLTTFNEADMTAIFAMRKKYQEQFIEKYGIKLGFMSLFAKACAKVLMEMPAVNAQISEDGQSLKYHDYADISIAVSTPTGLVVPPVHNVESLSLAEIEHKIAALAKKAREGSLSLAEMTGGTFTITNGGVFGSMMSTPIINEPQSAILGMHNIIQRPVAINGEVQIRPMMYLALSYDHRVIDGSASVGFLVKVKELLEDPMKLFLF